MMNKFRTVDKKKEILALLKGAPLSNCGEVWQTLSDLRHHHKIISIKDDVLNEAIVIVSKDPFQFNPKHPIYVRINHRDLIFKLMPKSFVVSGNKLACPYPKMAKAVDKRGEVRIPLPPERETTVVLRPLGAGVAELRVKLLDISKRGLGICISDLNREYLVRNEIFRLTAINDIELAGDHQVEIRYVERIGRGLIKSGFVLIRPFKNEIFEHVCRIIFGNTRA